MRASLGVAGWIVRFSVGASMLAGAWFPSAPLAAGDAPPPPPAAESTGAAAGTHAARANPRATLRTFIKSAHAAIKKGEPERMADAVACLDLSLVPEVSRKDQGPLLVKTLYDILARLWKIDWDTVPDDPQGPTFRRELSRGGQTYGELEVVRTSSGDWLLSADFTVGLPDLRNRVADLPYIEGLGGARDWAFFLEDHMPESFKKTFLVLPHWQWLGLLVLALLGLILDWIACIFFHLFFKHFFNRQKIPEVDAALKRAERPMGLVVAALVWWAGLYALNLAPGVYAWVAFGVKLFAVVAVSVAAYRTVDVLSAWLAWLASKTENTMDDLLVPLVRKTLKIFVAVISVVFIAEQIGFDVGKMLVGLGIGGLALALASKDTVENLFGSFTVVLDQPFKIGDWIKVGDTEGIVEEVGFRSTRIRTFASSLIVMPNSKLVNAVIENFSLRLKRRIMVTLSLTYDTPPEKIEAFCEGVREIIRRHPQTDKSGYVVHFKEWSASSLDVLMLCHVITPDVPSELAAREQIFLEILRLAKALSVSFAFPTQTIYTMPGSDPNAVETAANPKKDAP